MFFPEKNPYYHKNKEIKDMNDLIRNLDSFSEGEALWLASWIEYLGDKTLADRIRKTPSQFKSLIRERYNRLKKKLGGK